MRQVAYFGLVFLDQVTCFSKEGLTALVLQCLHSSTESKESCDKINYICIRQPGGTLSDDQCAISTQSYVNYR